MMRQIVSFVRRETVFCASAVLALASMAVIPPDRGYLAYPDYRSLSLLFCLMIIVAGFRSLGVFELLGRSLLRRAAGVRSLSIVLMLLCFFCSMLITNDVTLLTFVPFTLLVFRMIGQEERVLRLVVLETIAANLGSMATPIGNPQNLYLFSISGLSAGAFLRAVVPYAAMALVMLLGALLLQRSAAIDHEDLPAPTAADRPPLSAMAPFLALLVLCLLVVFRVLPYAPVLVIVAAAVLAVDRRLFRSVDYFLLLTFLCFFIFIGNLKRVPAVNDFLIYLVQGHELLAGVAASQIISNVPAAILLAGFTTDFAPLLTGVNLGGLGTLIASLASLISFKFFAAEYPDRKGIFFWVFTLWNAAFLAVLTAAALFLS